MLPGTANKGDHETDFSYETGSSKVPDPLKSDSPYHSSRFQHHRSDLDFFNFKRKVYEAHVRWAAGRGRDFVPDQPKKNLTTITENGKKTVVHGRLLQPLQQLLQTARSDARSQGRNITVTIASGYRSASTQFSSWDSNFAMYYERAVKSNVIKRGAYDQASAQKLSVFIRAKLGAPGYSNHQHGRAIDFRVVELVNGKRITAVVSTNPDNVSLWKKTWFWNWLNSHAHAFGFCPYLAEPWHWEFWKDVDPALKRCPQDPAASHETEELNFEARPGGDVKVKTGSYMGMKGVSVSTTARPGAKNIKDESDIIIACVSAVEGGFDTVNLYDKGILSWGIMQWSAHAGSLQKCLAFIKNSPLFISSFQNFRSLFGGLDINNNNQFVFQGVEYPIRNPNLPLIKLFRNSTDTTLVHYDEAVAKRWASIFSIAGRNPVVQFLQMEYTKQEIPAALGSGLGRKLLALKKIPKFKRHVPDTVETIGRFHQKIADYLDGSLKGRMLYFCMWTNNPSWAAIKLFHAVKSFIQLHNLPPDPATWAQNLKQEFGGHFEQVLRASTVGYWGDEKSARNKRESRTSKLIKKFNQLTSAVPVR